MQKLLILVLTTLGSYAGWAVGARVGLMTAFVLSVVGTGLGIHAGRRLTQRLLD